MTSESIVAFSLAAAALALVPGPTVTVIIANSLRYGARAGLMNVLGTQAGFVIWLVIAALGLGAAVQLMGVWFDVLRYAGAAYLVWLGIRMFRAKGDLAVAMDRARPHGSFFLQGFVVIISNPKMLVLFGAMIPPFLSPQGSAFGQIMVLGAIFMAIAAVGDTAYAVLAGRAGAFLSRTRIRALEVASGCFLAGGGIWMALRGR
ncbi:MAG TPA: LysE family translocator [Aestuariivirga sp.]|nr:LysE family translocator [Alphaproteobacteria bacterium]HRX36654.1 LysE family translocator [Aestuariivirga sp.]